MPIQTKITPTIDKLQARFVIVDASTQCVAQRTNSRETDPTSNSKPCQHTNLTGQLCTNYLTFKDLAIRLPGKLVIVLICVRSGNADSKNKDAETGHLTMTSTSAS